MNSYKFNRFKKKSLYLLCNLISNSFNNFNIDLNLINHKKLKQIIIKHNCANLANPNKLTSHFNSVCCLLKLNSKQIASSSKDNSIKIWDIYTGVCLITLKGHTKEIRYLIKLSNNQIASGSYDNTIKIWFWKDIRNDKKDSISYLNNAKKADNNYYNDNTQLIIKAGCLKTLLGHYSPITGLIKLNSNQIVSCSNNNIIKFWDIYCWKSIKTYNSDFTEISPLTVSDSTNPLGVIRNLVKLNMNQIAFCCGRIIKIFDILKGIIIKSYLGHASDIIQCIKLDETHIASVANGKDTSIRIWDLKSKEYGVDENCKKIIIGYKRSVMCLIRLDDRLFANGGNDNIINIWNYKTGQLAKSVSVDNSARCVYCILLLNKYQLACGIGNNSIEVVDLFMN